MEYRFLEEPKDADGREEFVQIVVKCGGPVVWEGERWVKKMLVWRCETRRMA